jgi:TPR repeat protein
MHSSFLHYLAGQLARYTGEPDEFPEGDKSVTEEKKVRIRVNVLVCSMTGRKRTVWNVSLEEIAKGFADEAENYGDFYAKYNYAFCLVNGLGVGVNVEQAQKLFQEVIEASDSENSAEYIQHSRVNAEQLWFSDHETRKAREW